jgi:glycosyltransferase involved in cell wall biosynthesis
MIGDGELRAACDQMISAQEIENRVSIVGWQRHLEQWYAKLDLIVLTSINEGTPVVLIEAMASGRPFVAVDVGGVRDLMVGDAVRVNQLEVFRNGILVPRDPKSIAQAITHLLEDENRRLDMGDTGREFVRERFSKQRMTQDLESLYSRVLRSKFETHPFSERSKPSESPLQS